jgi:cytochrome c-type biogenesis protein CcmH/NrfG
MARAAVKAKAKQQQAVKPGARRARTGRRGHAAGGNPNQQLFFMRLRRQAKWVYVLLAVLFAITFAFLGVGSGTNGLDQLFQGLNIFHHGGNSVSSAQKYIQAHPSDPKGFRDLATAYEAKGDTSNAISALQQYTNLRPKAAAVWSELAGLQATQAQTTIQQYRDAYTNRQLLAPSQSFLPTGKLGQALGTNKAEQVASKQADATLQAVQSRAQVALSSTVDSYDKVTKLTPKDSNAWFQLAQAAQQAGNYTVAVKAYKRYLVLNPSSTSKSQIEQLIKQLSPAAPPAKKTK